MDPLPTPAIIPPQPLAQPDAQTRLVPAPQTADPEAAQGPTREPMPKDPSANAFRAQQMFSDPAYLQEMAMIAMRNHQPGGLAFLERSAKVAKENGFEALGHLMRNDPDAAVAAFNKSGNFTDAVGAKRYTDGTWEITRKGGQTVRIDPEKDIESYMDPGAYSMLQKQKEALRIAEENRQEDRKVRQLYYEDSARARQTAADAAKQRAQTGEDIADARIAGTLPGGAGTRGTGTGTRSTGTKAGGVGEEHDPVALRQKYTEMFSKGERPQADVFAMVNQAMQEHVDVVGDRTSGFHLRDERTGRAIASYDTNAEAQEARKAWVAGKPLPKKQSEIDADKAKADEAAAAEAKKKADEAAAAKAAKVTATKVEGDRVRQVAWTPRGDPEQNRAALEHRANVAAIAASEPPADPKPQVELQRLMAIPKKMRTAQDEAKIVRLRAEMGI